MPLTLVDNGSVTRIAVVGGGPAGYEAALVAAQLGAEVTVIDSDGIGGACVLADCVPSKTLIATAESMTTIGGAAELGVRVPGLTSVVDLPAANARVKSLAQAQSDDIAARLAREGIEVIHGRARLVAHNRLAIRSDSGPEEGLGADAILVATGAHPRVLPGAEPDGERILSWRQVYDLDHLPERLIVIGSGVTGAEFASAYQGLGSQVTLVSSRDRVLPGEDVDAALLLESVFAARGMTVLKRSRAAGVVRTADGVLVTLEDGRTVEGSHALLAVGSIPNTAGLGLEGVGVTLDRGGFVQVDRVSRTTAPGVYAAGDCTGVLLLASVAAMQGRIAMWHSLGEAVTPLRLSTVAANIFTQPEIATVGVGQTMVESGAVAAHTVTLPLATNARAKMEGIEDGFVKLFSRPGTGTVLGGVVVAPRASELILAISLAVQHNLTVDQLANTFAIYPSLSGSLTEAARQLMVNSPT
ncbi:NAD(P)H-quinone dehydrogenase [Acidothermaceae bacterium B102]|nr:NAD(P)H-quinone dehydrogenase [Acidothermaceae bacterium B102]